MRFVLVFLFSVCINSAAAQDSIAYSHNYDFREGVYLTVEQFRNNNPLPKASIITFIPKAELDFMTQVMSQKNFSYRDSAGAEQSVKTETVWGYCQNRSVYINFNSAYNRINVIGTLCHLVAHVTIFSGTGIDPMNVNYSINNSHDELRQFVYDTRENKVVDFTVKNMETILSSDQELYKEFMALSKKKKSNSIFVFLRKFNASHPLYFPVN